MPRAKRIHYSGAFYHTILKGNNGRDIFFDESDKAYMSHLLKEAVKEFECKIHAFCFMTNHIHLLVEVGDIPLGKFVRDFARKYAIQLNKRLDQKGHLFQGRHKAYLVEKNDYFLALVRYIHLNPVEAHIVQDPSEYKWCSHNAYLGKNNIGWLTVSRFLSFFGEDENLATKHYRLFMKNYNIDSKKFTFH